VDARGHEAERAVRPSPAVFIADAVYSHIFNNSPHKYFTNLTIRCRHNGLGTRVYDGTGHSGLNTVAHPIRLDPTDVLV
jgi:hypothetical protein